jgi:hypothetical protein
MTHTFCSNLFITLVIFLFLTACGNPVTPPPFKIAMGTCNCTSSSPGTSLLIEFEFEKPPAGKLPITIYGPKSWNDDKPLNESTLFLSAPSGKADVEFRFADIAAISGQYRVVIEIEGRSYEQQTRVDASKLLSKAQNIQTGISVVGANAQWQNVEGAELYRAQLSRELSDNLEYIAAMYKRDPDFFLPTIANEGVTYFVNAVAYNFDFLRKEGVPAFFNTSDVLVEVEVP